MIVTRSQISSVKAEDFLETSKSVGDFVTGTRNN